MPKRPLLPEDLLRYVYVGDPLLSPDGARILFSHKVIDKRQAYVTSLYTVDLAGAVRKLTGATANAGGGRWSPDGARIAFTAAPDDIPQIHLIATDGGEAAAITDLPEGSISDLQWSPNGRYLAFTFRPRMEGFTKADAKQRQEEGGSPPPIVADSIWYRLDGDGYFGNTRYALYVLEVPEIGQKAEARQLYDKSPTGGYSYSWHPDSQSLIVAHSAREFPFRETPNDQLYVVNLDGGARMLPGLPSGEKSEPKYSPDGARIAYAGDVDENDPWGTRNDKIYVTNANGGAPIDLTGHDDYDMGVATLSDTAEAAFGVRMTWNADGSGLYVQVGRHGGTNIAQLGLDKSLTFVTEGDHAVKLGNVAAGRIAVTISTPSDLPEVGVIEDGVVRRLTHFNDAFHAEVETRAPESHWLESTDGVRVQVWVMHPAGKTDTDARPVLLNVHGGPHAQYGWTYFHEFQVFAALGYTVVYGNPRGSKGYGEAFTAAIRGNWGTKDWEDVQTITRWMKSQPWADTKRLVIMGGSYGGYMTNWAIGHTDEFACAVSDRCVSNMVSMAGSSDFPFNKNGYFQGVAWGSLDDIAALWRQSPIAYFENVKTPTLVIHSEGDLRCNIEQGEQVFTALQQQGVPSRLVRYPSSTSHGMSRSGPPDLRLHRLNEYLTWIAKWLK